MNEPTPKRSEKPGEPSAEVVGSGGNVETTVVPVFPVAAALRFIQDGGWSLMIAEDPAAAFRVGQALEIAIRSPNLVEVILQARYGEPGFEELCRKMGAFSRHPGGDPSQDVEAGKLFILEHTMAEWSCKIAEAKLLLLDLGFISARDGDLRKAELRPERDQALALLQLGAFRAKPEVVTHVLAGAIKEGGPGVAKFFRRLGDVLAKPAFVLPDNPPPAMCGSHRALQATLIANWAVETFVDPAVPSFSARIEPGTKVDEASGILPPLYTFSEGALFDYLTELASKKRDAGGSTWQAEVLKMNQESLNMVCRRLGLHRPQPALWFCVEWDTTRRALRELIGTGDFRTTCNRLVVSSFRRQRSG